MRCDAMLARSSQSLRHSTDKADVISFSPNTSISHPSRALDSSDTYWYVFSFTQFLLDVLVLILNASLGTSREELLTVSCVITDDVVAHPAEVVVLSLTFDGKP